MQQSLRTIIDVELILSLQKDLSQLKERHELIDKILKAVDESDSISTDNYCLNKSLENKSHYKNFQNWIAEGNAIESQKGTWVEQTTQYRKKFSQIALYDFFVKEFVDGEADTVPTYIKAVREYLPTTSNNEMTYRKYLIEVSIGILKDINNKHNFIKDVPSGEDALDLLEETYSNENYFTQFQQKIAFNIIHELYEINKISK